MNNNTLQKEKDRIIANFATADEKKLAALDNLIEQAAYETLYLRRLNRQALESGLVKFHPEDCSRQKTLPVSAEIAKHSAALTNIMDKLMKHLAVSQEDEDDELREYEDD